MICFNLGLNISFFMVGTDQNDPLACYKLKISNQLNNPITCGASSGKVKSLESHLDLNLTVMAFNYHN